MGIEARVVLEHTKVVIQPLPNREWEEASTFASWEMTTTWDCECDHSDTVLQAPFHSPIYIPRVEC